MPRHPINYSNTIIYKIVCNDLTITDLYVGSTTDFAKRKSGHKSDSKRHPDTKIYKSITTNGGWDNWQMVEIEKFPCQDGNEARARERYWFEVFDAKLNTINPSRSQHERNIANTDLRKQYNLEHTEERKMYVQNNQQHINDTRQQYRLKNESHIKETQKAYRIKNAEHIKELKLAWYYKNK